MPNVMSLATTTESANVIVPLWERQDGENIYSWEAFSDFCTHARSRETPHDYIKRVHDSDSQIMAWAIAFDWPARRSAKLEYDHKVTTLIAQTALAIAIEKAIPALDNVMYDLGYELSRLRSARAMISDPVYAHAVDLLNKTAKSLASLNSSLSKNVINVNAQSISMQSTPSSTPVFGQGWAGGTVEDSIIDA